jgi:glycosyltransferase involved in cell wall biosynthesis
LKILYTIADLQPESGGPSRSVSALAAAVGNLGNEVEVLALQYASGNSSPLVPPSPVKTTLVPNLGRQQFRCPPAFKSALSRALLLAPRSSLLHDNGLWLPTNHAAAVVSRELKLPRIVSPRGMLTQWALRHKGWKKRLAWKFYQQRDLQSAQVLHATSQTEAAEFRALGLTQPVAVIPNGVAMPGEVEKAEGRRQKTDVGDQKAQVGSQKSEVRTILFLGRIHPIKGLLNLVKAWATIQKSEVGGQRAESRGRWSVIRSQPRWRVVIAGGDENGHLAEVKAEIAKLGAGSLEQGAGKFEESFQFIGEVADNAKWDLYRNADLFVLPTHSENFGIVIAEALACGVPVITTRGTPWEDLITHRCGWWVEIGAKPLANALNAAMKVPEEERRAMGLRGRRLVEENYTWPAAAKKMVAVYQWMLESGPKPEWVI